MSLNVARFNKDNLLDDSDDEFGEILLYFACEEYNQLYLSKQPCRNSALSGHEYVMEVLHEHWSRCYDLFRMNKDVFKLFCGVLKEFFLLKNSRYLSVEEQVAMFLFVIGHNERHRVNCVGAIDVTHISAHVPIDEQIPYRGRKVDTTQNVMCVCSFDMKFTYIVPGWEGSANDARIFLECAKNPDYGFPMPPQGKYYLVDSGYTNMPGFLSPY
ncbi:uncharacterized protein LOC133831084 [Humulus lupulus]|uniref:uncharacterized protein LOC133831084 n=1 Tax=Humulus lupulus TaxID=3486 RepID=UPI002B403993|nr:uncharacterized protein LOC133831084 [Humulus lupulus]